jgi:hypothetical protein
VTHGPFGITGKISRRIDARGSLVLHVNREALHHLAEVSLLRDLYRATGGARLT